MGRDSLVKSSGFFPPLGLEFSFNVEFYTEVYFSHVSWLRMAEISCN